MPPSSAISATYRLQFSKDFTFQDASNLLDYLSEMGITHVYASPILSSRRGSTHGYDVIDPTQLNPELGTEADFLAFQDKLQRNSMGLILDIVPNHMSASSENSWWMDVLENGPESAHASCFDIDWHPPSRNLDGKILLPVLGRPFGEVLEQEELKLVFLGTVFSSIREAPHSSNASISSFLAKIWFTAMLFIKRRSSSWRLYSAWKCAPSAFGSQCSQAAIDMRGTCRAPNSVRP